MTRQAGLFQSGSDGIYASELFDLARLYSGLMKCESFTGGAAISVGEKTRVRLVGVSSKRLARQIKGVRVLQLLVAVTRRLAKESPYVLDDFMIASLDCPLEPSLVIARVIRIAGGVLDPPRLHLIDLPMQIADKRLDCIVKVHSGSHDSRSR